jgi:hypothetical protein
MNKMNTNKQHEPEDEIRKKPEAIGHEKGRIKN